MKFCPECGAKASGSTCYSCGALLAEYEKIKNENASLTLFYFDYTTDKNGKITLIKFKQDLDIKRVVIPSNVVEIKEKCFAYSSIEEIVLPSTITAIADYTFYYCKKLKSIEFSPNVTKIGCYAFCGCSMLDELVLPRRIELIGQYAFESCTNLSFVFLPASLKSVGANAFEHCTGLLSVDTENLISYCNIDFANPTACPVFYARDLTENDEDIVNVTFDKVSRIRPFIFTGVDTLESVTFTCSNSSISPYAFWGCSSLRRINVKNEGCPSFQAYSNTLMQANKVILACKKSTIPSFAHSICAGAYCTCSDEEEITIPHWVKTIEMGALFGCSSLEKITLPSLPPVYNALSNLFSTSFNASDLTESGDFMPDNLASVTITANTTILSHAFLGFDLDEIRLLSNVTVQNFGLSGCVAEKLVIGNVELFDQKAFAGCLVEVVESLPSASRYTVEKNCIVTQQKTTYNKIEKHLVYAGSENPSFPENVAHVLPYSITNNEITWIKFPDSVKSIAQNAISCPKLKKVVFGTGLSVLYSESFSSTSRDCYLFFPKKSNWTFFEHRGVERAGTIDTEPIHYDDLFCVNTVSYDNSNKFAFKVSVIKKI